MCVLLPEAIPRDTWINWAEWLGPRNAVLLSFMMLGPPEMPLAVLGGSQDRLGIEFGT